MQKGRKNIFVSFLNILGKIKTLDFRLKFLVIHHSGAAYFYTRDDCDLGSLPENLRDRDIMGICYHKKYGQGTEF